MAGRGPAAKRPSEKVRRHAEQRTELGGADRPEQPKLPKSWGLLDDETGKMKAVTFLAGTREWWEAWVSSPMARAFLATDWHALRRIAILIDRFHRTPTTALAAEIRLQEAKLGATIDDRLRLRMDVTFADVADGDPVPGAANDLDRRRAERAKRLA